MKHAILFEPIFRGSRVQVLGWMLAALTSSGWSCTVIARKGWKDQSSLLPEFVLPNLVVRELPFEIASWYRNLTRREWREARKLIKDCSRENKTDLIVLTATDEYWTPLTLYPLNIGVPTLAIKYRLGFLHARPPAGTVARIRRTSMQLLWKVTRARMPGVWAGFDELAPSQTSRIALLPDPSPPGLEPVPMATARSAMQLPSNQPVLLQMGRQDPRKGLTFLLEALPSLINEIPNVLVWVQGKIPDEKLQQQVGELQRKFPHNLTWKTNFLPDHELGFAYSAANAVLLPYTPEFTTTSGVLACAVACRKPVVASSHGVIGHRTREHELGATFEHGNIGQFTLACRVALHGHATGEKYERFLSSCTPDAFMRRFQEIVNGS